MSRASFIATVLLLVTPAAEAKLASTTFDSLLAEAELVVEATPKQLTRKELGAGEATLTVLRVVRGAYAGAEITVRWDTEVHDQHIDRLDQDWLLFLKRAPSGEYVAAQYGRSYWPFTSTVTDPAKANLDHESRGFVFEYPLTMVTLTPAQKKALFAPGPSASKAPVIQMSRLRAFLGADAGR